MKERERERNSRLACRVIVYDVRETFDDIRAIVDPCGMDGTVKIGNKIPDSSVNRFALDSPSSGGSNGAEIDRGIEGARWASGSGLTQWSSQGWAHDQILSLIWRRFTQKSPFSSLSATTSSTFPSFSRRLIIPANVVDFTAPVPWPPPPPSCPTSPCL